MAAAFSRTPELAIGENAAGMIAVALVDVSQYFNLNPSGPSVALFKLAGALAIVNVPILAAISQRRAAERAAARSATQFASPDDFVPPDGDGRRQYSFN